MTFQWWLPPPSGTYDMDAASTPQPSASDLITASSSRSDGRVRTSAKLLLLATVRCAFWSNP